MITLIILPVLLIAIALVGVHAANVQVHNGTAITPTGNYTFHVYNNTIPTNNCNPFSVFDRPSIKSCYNTGYYAGTNSTSPVMSGDNIVGCGVFSHWNITQQISYCEGFRTGQLVTLNAQTQQAATSGFSGKDFGDFSDLANIPIIRRNFSVTFGRDTNTP